MPSTFFPLHFNFVDVINKNILISKKIVYNLEWVVGGGKFIWTYLYEISKTLSPETTTRMFNIHKGHTQLQRRELIEVEPGCISSLSLTLKLRNINSSHCPCS